MKRIGILIACVAVLLCACTTDDSRSSETNDEHPVTEQASRDVPFTLQFNQNYEGEVWLRYEFPCEPADFGFVPLSEHDPEYNNLRPELAEALRAIMKIKDVNLVAAGSQDVSVRPEDDVSSDAVNHRVQAVFAQHDICASVITSV